MIFGCSWTKILLYDDQNEYFKGKMFLKMKKLITILINLFSTKNELKKMEEFSISTFHDIW